MEVSVIHFFQQEIGKISILQDYKEVLAHITVGILLLLIAFIADKISRQFFISIIHRITKKTATEFDDILFENKVFTKLAHLSPVIVLMLGVEIVFDIYPITKSIFSKILQIALIFTIARAMLAFLSASQQYLSKTEELRDKPIASYVQLLKLISYLVAAVLAIATILGQSPFYLLSALGAFTAILLLIFKDSILGLVASVQMTADDLVKVGDWISMPKYGADGDVINISLNTIKVQNFDKTITSIPSYAMISDSFTNWRGMQISGGRRIKRSLHISPSSISFLGEELFQKFSKIDLISSYLTTKQKEIDEWNARNNHDTSFEGNGRRQTNLGVFRNYLHQYLLHNTHILSSEPIMVRQLASNEHGLPLEIYCFANTIIWEDYEAVQANLFDHVFAMAKVFDLEIMHLPSDSTFKFLQYRN